MPNNRRMFAHDYTRRGFYMVTILTAGRRRLFGECRDGRVHLSPAGALVRRRWAEIPLHRPAVEASTLVVMPDHLHGIVYVTEQLPRPVGETIRGFKSGVTSALRREQADPGLAAWEEGYHDRVIMNADTLRAERHYIRDNPRRYSVRKAHPERFVTVAGLDHPRLPAGRAWAGVGNRDLLDKPALLPVQVSRRADAAQRAALRAGALDVVHRGAVMVSPFLSPGEREIAAAVMARDYGSLVLLTPRGFPPLYKPPGAWFDLCAKGRLLVLSPYRHTGRAQPLTRARCLEMNGLVAALCGGGRTRARMRPNNGAPR